LAQGKVLLIRPTTTMDALAASEDAVSEHLGLGYLAAYLETHGCEVDVCDTVLEKATNREVAGRVSVGDYPLVGIAVPSQRGIFKVLELARAIKEVRPDSHVCLGGHFPTIVHDLLLRDFPCLDSVVRGEGEEPFLALASHVLGGRRAENVPGLTFRGDGRVVSTPPAMPVENLDDLPFPKRSATPAPWGSIRYAGMVSSRGCQYKCPYCSIHTFYGCSQWRGRSIANVVDEMAELASGGVYQGFSFSDDTFVPPGPTGRTRVTEFCDQLAGRGLDRLSLVAMLPPASVSTRTIDQLFKVGLRSVLVGIESASPAQLRRLGKATTSSINRRVLDILTDFDLVICAGWIMFDPDCTLDDLKMNVDFLRPYAERVLFEPLTTLEVFTGSHLYRDLASRGRLQGTYLAPKYEFLDEKVRWVHRVATALMEDRIIAAAQWTSEQDDPAYGRFRRQRMLGFVLEILGDLTEFARLTDPLPPAEEAVAKLEGTVASGFRQLMKPMEKG
jgi:anaerobic magnesium-protoporphyrin IX monomethyl ester cyclase